MCSLMFLASGSLGEGVGRHDIKEHRSQESGERDMADSFIWQWEKPDISSQHPGIAIH